MMHLEVVGTCCMWFVALASPARGCGSLGLGRGGCRQSRHRCSLVVGVALGPVQMFQVDRDRSEPVDDSMMKHL